MKNEETTLLFWSTSQVSSEAQYHKICAADDALFKTPYMKYQSCKNPFIREKLGKPQEEQLRKDLSYRMDRQEIDVCTKWLEMLI